MAKEVDSMKEETISALSILEPAKANGGLPPITVGNPDAVADLAIDQSHLEEFANLASESAVVECRRPARGVFFTVKREVKQALGRSRLLFRAADGGTRSLPRRAPDRETEDGGGRDPPRLARSLCHHGRRGRPVAIKVE